MKFWNGLIWYPIFFHLHLGDFFVKIQLMFLAEEKWVDGKSGCFDRVTLSDDDGRCHHFPQRAEPHQRHHWRARRPASAAAQIRACVAPDTTLGRERDGTRTDRYTAPVDLRPSPWTHIMVVLDMAANQATLTKAEIDRMSHYVSSPYVQPLPNEVCYIIKVTNL